MLHTQKHTITTFRKRPIARRRERDEHNRNWTSTCLFRMLGKNSLQLIVGTSIIICTYNWEFVQRFPWNLFGRSIRILVYAHFAGSERTKVYVIKFSPAFKGNVHMAMLVCAPHGKANTAGPALQILLWCKLGFMYKQNIASRNIRRVSSHIWNTIHSSNEYWPE